MFCKILWDVMACIGILFTFNCFLLLSIIFVQKIVESIHQDNKQDCKYFKRRDDR